MSEDWLNPMNKIIWIKAFRSKETEVTLRDGRKFNVEYEVPERPGIVHVKPTAGLVPMGFFEYTKVIHNSWLTDQ